MEAVHGEGREQRGPAPGGRPPRQARARPLPRVGELWLRGSAPQAGRQTLSQGPRARRARPCPAAPPPSSPRLRPLSVRHTRASSAPRVRQAVALLPLEPATPRRPHFGSSSQQGQEPRGSHGDAGDAGLAGERGPLGAGRPEREQGVWEGSGSGGLGWGTRGCQGLGRRIWSAVGRLRARSLGCGVSVWGAGSGVGSGRPWARGPEWVRGDPGLGVWGAGSASGAQGSERDWKP